ncbi:hypothetical protein Efla_002799 [Eimeria flavescens]
MFVCFPSRPGLAVVFSPSPSDSAGKTQRRASRCSETHRQAGCCCLARLLLLQHSSTGSSKRWGAPPCGRQGPPLLSMQQGDLTNSCLSGPPSSRHKGRGDRPKGPLLFVVNKRQPQLSRKHTTALGAGGPPEGALNGGPPPSDGEDAARRLRLEALLKTKEEEERHTAFPVALRLPHPELVAGVTYRRLGAPTPQAVLRRQQQQQQPQQQQRQQQQQQEEGPLVSSVCVGTAMIGGNVMQDDEAAMRMLCSAYEDYGINFYDVGELDPLPHAPHTHGSGHRGVLRRFFQRYKAAAGNSSSSNSNSSSSSSSRGGEESRLRAEASRLFVSVRLLSGSLGPFDYERLALERRRLEAVAAAAARDAAAAGADAAAAATAAADAAAAAVQGDVEGSTRWARPSGWWARGPHGASGLELTEQNLEAAVDRMLQQLGIECIDLLQLTEPHRYVPRQDRGEDTYCWALERPDAIPIEKQLEMMAGLVRKGKVRYLGVSNETSFGLHRWVQAADEMGLPRVVASQHLYNLLHRNEVESSGIPEMAYRLGVPVVAYGVLAGGILTGKYLDPERQVMFHSKGPDVRPHQDEFENGIGAFRFSVPEDFGYLSFGPATGRANLWPETYHTHRSVWSQWLMGEIVKTARQFGMTAAQLALAWVYSRPFVASTIIGPRTTGQLRESVLAQNYSVADELSRQLHELYLHYAAPTMGGPQLLSLLPDAERQMQPALSQADFFKWGKQPIWSGGTYWANWPLPVLPEMVDYFDRKEFARELRGAAAALDDPQGVYRGAAAASAAPSAAGAATAAAAAAAAAAAVCSGEYFAVKEQQLFGWDEQTVDGFELRNTTQREKEEQHHMDWHLCWKGGEVSSSSISRTVCCR